MNKNILNEIPKYKKNTGSNISTAQRKQNISIIMKNVLYNIILVFLAKSLISQLIYKAIALFVEK